MTSQNCIDKHGASLGTPSGKPNDLSVYAVCGVMYTVQDRLMDGLKMVSGSISELHKAAHDHRHWFKAYS